MADPVKPAAAAPAAAKPAAPAATLTITPAAPPAPAPAPDPYAGLPASTIAEMKAGKAVLGRFATAPSPVVEEPKA